MTELASTDYTLFQLVVKMASHYKLLCTYVENQPFVMEVDTGAALSVINESIYKSSPILNKLPLQSSTVQLRTYTGKEITVFGELSVKVQSGSQVHTLSLLIMSGQGPILLGRNWLLKLQLDWKSIFSL